MDILFYYVAQPICQLLIPVSALNLFSKERDNKLIIGSTIAIILLVISNGGRFILLYYLIHVIFISGFMNKLIHISKKIKNIARFILVLVIVGIVYVTVSRGSLIGESIYIYLCGCIPFMSTWINTFDSTGSYTYGFMSFQGFIRPPFAIIRKIGLISTFPQLLVSAENSSLLLNQPLSIGGTNQFNSFASLFYYFYVDFGILGVILLSMIYGYICKNAFSNLKKRCTNTNIIIYSLLLQSMITSMVRFQFSIYMFALSFVYLILIKPRKVEMNRLKTIY